MSLPYVEQSQKIVQALDPEQVAAMPIGKMVYENGFLSQYTLGEVLLGGETLYLGIELPDRRCSSQMLFGTRLHQISYMIREVPELLPYAPTFVGAVAGEEEKAYWARGVLIEDLTQGGRYPLQPQPASEDIREKSVQLGIRAEGPHALLTAQPTGHEKIVHFFPAPFLMTYATSDALRDDLSGEQEGLTVGLGTDSNLAVDLSGHE